MGLVCLLLPLAVFAGGRDAAHDRYFVEFKNFNSHAAQAIRAAGGKPVHEFSRYGVIAAQLPAHALKALSGNPNVARVVEDPPRYPMSETTPYGIDMVQAPLVSDDSAANRMVCVIDSGYYTGHEDLSSSGVSGTSDPGGAGNWYEDSCGHGTHVSGTISAIGGNGLGVVGVLPGGNSGRLSLHMVKVFDGPDCGWAYSSDLISALQACESAGANVVSMSLGGPKGRGPWEQNAFDSAYANGILSIAAAGNDGSTSKSYPASYDSVVSVAAIDETKTVADFSQKNDQVELAAPGVDVLSTIPFRENVTLTAGGSTYQGNHITNAPRTDATSGTLVDGGLCDSTGSWSGAVVLCERGSISFYDKVINVQNSGGAAAVIYNNATGNFFGTLGDGNSSTIPAISLSQADGQNLVASSLGTSADIVDQLVQPASGYAYYNGTSMATPHVSAVAALVWSRNTAWTNQQVRDALDASAEDLGPVGRDNSYGYGLVQAADAVSYLGGGSGGGNNPPTASFSNSCTDLACDFDGSGSSDSDGSIASYAWDFGDGSTGSGVTASHSYAAGGTYTVTLTVTDDGGVTDSTSQDVTVSSSGSGGGITLAASGYKVKGRHTVDLTWSGATTANVDIYRGGNVIATTANDGAYTDSTNNRGSATYTYQVCEAGSSVCSSAVNVVF